jgi:hypothetical protein
LKRAVFLLKIPGETGGQAGRLEDRNPSSFDWFGFCGSHAAATRRCIRCIAYASTWCRARGDQAAAASMCVDGLKLLDREATPVRLENRSFEDSIPVSIHKAVDRIAAQSVLSERRACGSLRRV